MQETRHCRESGLVKAMKQPTEQPPCLKFKSWLEEGNRHNKLELTC